MAALNSSSDENDDYYEETASIDATGIDHANEWLIRDLTLFKQCYGSSIVKFVDYHGIDMIDVDLHVNPNILEREPCAAWNIAYNEDIIVKIHFSLSKYVFGQNPSVQVSQASMKDKCRLVKQLQNIAQNFVSKQWQEVRYHYSQQTLPSPEDICRFHPNVRSETISTLVNMGFPIERVNKACFMCSGNLQEALDLLINDTNGCILDDVICGSIMKDSKELSASPVASHKTDDEQPCDQDKTVGGFREDLHLIPMSSGRPARIKAVPNIKNGFLVQVYQYVCQRLPTLNEFCVVCDEPHVFQNGPMLKPSLCARELCYFAHQELGVMADSVIDIASGAEVVDLHLAIASAACGSKRRNLVFDPFPSIINPENTGEFVLSPKKKDYQRVMKALAAVPPMKELTSLTPDALKSKLDKKDPLAYPLTQWIIFSNRCHIIKLPPEMQLQFMHTPHQFLLLSSPPAKEQSFLEAKQEHGVVYAFHGSHIENWHSIMRMGLLNASGTKHQLHGAAFGKGIYLSPFSGVSFGYSNMGWGKHNAFDGRLQCQDPYSRFLRSKNLNCIALCEVVSSKELRKATQSVWVCSNPDHVCTRFFFVYEDGRVGDLSVNTENQVYKVQISKAIQSYKQMFKNHFSDGPT